MPFPVFCKLAIRCAGAYALTIAIFAFCPACGSSHALIRAPSDKAQNKNRSSDTALAKLSLSAMHTDTASIADSVADDNDTTYENPADFIEEAKEQCDKHNFGAADSALREAVRGIVASDQNAEGNGETRTSTGFIDEIANIYKTRMPASFGVPDEIALSVFQRRMMSSIDSMNALPLDSVSLAAITCQKTVEYDVPMVWNRRVQRALSFYIRNRDVTIDKWFTRAAYYLPLMKKMFADSGLPKDLAYLPLIESGFNPLAYSYANASGIWQFIASTGKLYGLKRSFWVDERRDPIRSTGAAIAYFRKLYGEFGHWHLALAAYNCGENGVAHCIARLKTNDYWLLKRLPKQTRNYVPCYLAALTIAKNPKCFGVSMSLIDTLPLDTVHVTECISLGDIAAGLSISRDTLQKINPHILRWCTPADSTGSLLYLPKGCKKSWNVFLAQLPPEKRVTWYRYEIKYGDNVAGLGSRYNVAPDALTAINRITDARLVPGHHVFIPLSPVVLPPTVAYAAPPESEIKALDLPDYEYSGISLRHRVHSGDNLGRIARHYHVSIAQLCRWNHLTGRTLLRPGRVLVVSRPQPPVESTPPPALVAAPLPKPHVDTAKIAGAVAQAPAQPQKNAEQPPVAQSSSAAPVQTHVVEIGETAFSISRKHNITLNDLALLNGLDIAHPTIKIGQILVLQPSRTAAKKDSVHKEPAFGSVASVNSAPAGVPVNRQGDQARDLREGANRFHVVAPGEDVFRISLRYSVSVDSLMSANRISNALAVRAGDTLMIPSGNNVLSKRSAESFQADIIYYKLKDGDTLMRIAAEFGVPVDSLYKANKLRPDTVLTPGKVIRVVKSTGM